MRKLFLLITVLVVSTNPSWSAFELERPGARAAGLAGAFTALADNADALLYNPAGLMGINQHIISSNYAQLLTGLDNGSISESELAYILPLEGNHALGLMWYQKNSLDLYQENMLTLGYSQTMDREEKIKAGLALDLLFLSYLDSEAIANNPIFKERSTVVTAALDLGIIYKLAEPWSLGLMLANLNQPNIAISDDQANLPIQVKFGSAYQLEELAAALDLLLSDNQFRLSTGGEYWWYNNQLGARAGYAIGSGKLSELAIGATYVLRRDFWALHLDYAFVLPLGEQQALGSTHQISLQYRFTTSNLSELERDGLKLKKMGKQALAQGKQIEALAMWEEAIEYLPEDEELATAILSLQDELEKSSEFMVYRNQGLDYEKQHDLINARKAYHQALEIIPENDEVNLALTRVTKKLQSLNKNELVQSKAQVEKGEAQIRTSAKKNLTKANRLYSKQKNNRQLRRYFEPDINRLNNTLITAKTAYRNKDYATADAKSVSIITELERLQTRALVKARARSKQAKTVTTKKSKKSQRTGKPTSSSQTTKKVQSKVEQQKTLKKKARGAYGRAIKLMIDIDQLRGATYYPSQVQRMKNKLVVIKSKLLQGKYDQVISTAKKIYPELEALKKSCNKKERARQAMPLNW